MTRTSLKTAVIFTLIYLFSLGGLASCGKRGDPVRPSDVEQTG
ncbi:MAG: hypothetical protein ACPGU2_00990 [Candidatus Puniceispirillaceae bacterium]